MVSNTEKIIKEFKRAKISKEDKLALLTAILEKINALPLRQTILAEGTSIKLNGKALSKEQIINLKTNVMALKDNPAHQLFKDQLTYLALNLGIVKSVGIDELFFCKAAALTKDQTPLKKPN